MCELNEWVVNRVNEMKCVKCNDSKRVLNPEWERIWEYYDNMAIFDMDTCCEKADREADKYLPCPKCS